MHSSLLSAILLYTMTLAAKVLKGDVQASARLITLIEDDSPSALEITSRFAKKLNNEK